MRKILLLTLCAFLFLSAQALGFSSQGQDCSKCHTLKKDEAAELIKAFVKDPNIKVLEVRTLPFKALWEVEISSGGKKGLVYVDLSKRYLISGQIAEIKTRKNLTEERMTDINRVDVSKIPLKDAIVMGDKSARHKVVVFDDPD